MRILIITTFFPPLNSIASLRPYSWAKCWCQDGHEVKVLTMQKPARPETDLPFPNPGFQVIEVPPPRFVQALKREYQQGSPSFLKSPLIGLYDYLRLTRGIFNACRMPDFADFWIGSALKAARGAGTWDLVVSTAGPYAVHIVGEKLKRERLARFWIADYRDNWSDNHIYPGLFPFTLVEKMLERKLMRSADRITATSAPFAAKMQARYGQERVHVIENGCDPDHFAGLPPHSPFPADGKFRIVYTGTIYPKKQDPSPFFQALSELSQDLLDKLEVLFVGHQLDHLLHLIRHYGVEPYVRILGFVSHGEALLMQRDAHLLLFIVWKDLAERGVYSGKIYEYLFSGTPIMAVGAAGEEESQALIQESRTGTALTDVAAIKRFLTEKIGRGVKEQLQADGQVLARYNRQTLARKLLKLVPAL